MKEGYTRKGKLRIQGGKKRRLLLKLTRKGATKVVYNVKQNNKLDMRHVGWKFPSLFILQYRVGIAFWRQRLYFILLFFHYILCKLFPSNSSVIIFFQLVALLTHGYQFPQLQLDNFIKPLSFGVCRQETHEMTSLKDSSNSTKYEMPYRAVLLMAEMGKLFTSLFIGYHKSPASNLK